MSRAPKFPISIGMRFGKLTVASETLPRLVAGKLRYFLECKCDCGESSVIRRDHIMNGHARSCGCLIGSVHAHGLRSHPLYTIWRRMKQRCNWPKEPGFKNYGGRGIGVSKEWSKFTKFYEDMSPTYRNGLSLDRKDNNLGYSKENCRWATRTEQANNQRNNVRIELNGVSKTISEWSRISGVHKATITNRLHAGWKPEHIMSLVKYVKHYTRVAHA